MRPPLNLASRPFRNKNVPRLLIGLLWVGLIGLTLKHALVIQGLLPSRTTALHREVDEVEARVSEKQSSVSRLRTERVEPAVMKRWTLIKELVDRRGMSWTRLLAVLEEVLPADARLVEIAPQTREGKMQLTLEAVVQSTESGLTLVKTLEDRPEFESVVPLTWRTTERGEEVKYEMSYRAGSRTPAPAAAEPPPGEQEAPADDEGAVPPSPPAPPGAVRP